MHFCQSRKLHLDPELILDDVQIEVVLEFKFSGLLFDSNLSFIPHINYLSNKCQKALGLLRVVSSMDWGADRKVLLKLYRSLVRSKLDYGCIVYGSARQSYLRKFDSIHNQSLPLAFGAFRTSHVNSLYAEGNESSLNSRRKKLSLQFYLKLKSNPYNPTHKVVFEPLYKDEFKAIDLALNHIEQDAYLRNIIFTDSLSAMQGLEGKKTDNPLIVSLLEKLSRLCERADIVFCWLPSHVGICGNEEADKAAKDALSLEVFTL